MRPFIFITLGGIYAWLAATAFDAALAMPMLRSAHGSILPLLQDLLIGNQEFVYLGAAMGFLGVILVRRRASVLRQLVGWTMIGLVIYAFIIFAFQIKGTGKIIAWQNLLPRTWIRPSLLVPTLAVAILLPVTEALFDGVSMLLWRLRHPRAQIQADDVDFDALDNREEVERAANYLAAKRRANAGAARPNDTWAVEE